MRGAAKPPVKLRALIPECPGIGDLGHRAPEEDRGEIGDPTDMAQWLQDQSGRLPATRRAAIDADVGAAAQKLGLRSGLRRDCLRKSKCHVLRLERGGCLYCGAREVGAGALRESTHSTDWVLRRHEAALQQVEDSTS